MFGCMRKHKIRLIFFKIYLIIGEYLYKKNKQEIYLDNAPEWY